MPKPARAKTDQVAADKLAAQVQAAKDPTGKNTAPKTNSNNGTNLFDQLTGQGQSQQSGGAPVSTDDFETAVITALRDAHTRADGSVDGFSKA
jgi:hypothetical protein